MGCFMSWLSFPAPGSSRASSHSWRSENVVQLSLLKDFFASSREGLDNLVGITTVPPHGIDKRGEARHLKPLKQLLSGTWAGRKSALSAQICLHISPCPIAKFFCLPRANGAFLDPPKAPRFVDRGEEGSNDIEEGPIKGGAVPPPPFSYCSRNDGSLAVI